MGGGFGRRTPAAGKQETQLDELPPNLPWKMTVAKTLKAKHGATNT